MLIKIKNVVWQAKIKSAWLNEAQAPLEVFFFLIRNPIRAPIRSDPDFVDAGKIIR